MKLFWFQGFFTEIKISKIDVKMNLRIIMKKYTADPERGSPKKSILQPFGLTGLFRQRGS